jgi:starch synthase
MNISQNNGFSHKSKVLFAAAEVSPIAKVGGLADVVGSLPSALKDFGVEAVVAIPFYDFLQSNVAYKMHLLVTFSVPFNGKLENVKVFKTTLPESKVTVYLYEWVHSPLSEIYGSATMSGGLYVNPEADLERFVFFSLAVVESLKFLKNKFDIIHCHDWHTALIPYLLPKNSQKTVLTIHNLANQGIINDQLVSWLNSNILSSEKIGSQFNLLALGIKYADKITTVSESYTKEILTPLYGCGLEVVLGKYKQKLVGIVNGIDIKAFDPATDNNIKKKYSIGSLKLKACNKVALQKLAGLNTDPTIPLFGLVSRFVEQKGLDLITERIIKLPAQYVFLGAGDPTIEGQLLNMASKNNNFRVIKGFDAKLAQLIYAGADFFLMPSRFEPCGLGQLIAMRYGTLPIVRRTGGLKDTVTKDVGLVFNKPSATVLYKTIQKALTDIYAQPKTFKQMKMTAMKQDFSWSKSAFKYAKIYSELANIK